MWFAFFLNQGDRQVYNSVLPLIRDDLGLDEIQLGLVATIFTIVYGLLVPFAGYAGDVYRRKYVVLISLSLFSLGTLLTGLAGGFLLLIVFRSTATGAGEAFYYPAANSLIGHYHTQSRAQAMAIHQTANYTGVVLGGFIAAWIGEDFGWRMSFFTYGILGLILAVVILYRLRDPDKPGEAVGEIEEKERVSPREVLAVILKIPTILFLSLAFGFMVFVHIGYVTWMPTFLHEKFDLSLANAGFSSMFYHHLAAYVGVLAGGRISDVLATRRRQVRMELEIVGLLLGAPFIYLLGASGSLAITYLALAGFGLFRGIYDSNLFAALFDVVEPRYRSSATGVMVAFAFIVGALSPVFLGWMKLNVGLDYGMSLLSLLYVAGAASIFIGLKFFFHKDFVEERPNPETV